MEGQISGDVAWLLAIAFCVIGFLIGCLCDLGVLINKSAAARRKKRTTTKEREGQTKWQLN